MNCGCEKAALLGLKQIKEEVEKWDKDKQELIYFGKIGDCQKWLWFLMETTSWVMGEPFGTCVHTKPIRTVLTSLFPASVRTGNNKREPVCFGSPWAQDYFLTGPEKNRLGWERETESKITIPTQRPWNRDHRDQKIMTVFTFPLTKGERTQKDFFLKDLMENNDDNDWFKSHQVHSPSICEEQHSIIWEKIHKWMCLLAQLLLLTAMRLTRKCCFSLLLVRFFWWSHTSLMSQTMLRFDQIPTSFIETHNISNA